jgi:hypothetical protein
MFTRFKELVRILRKKDRPLLPMAEEGTHCSCCNKRSEQLLNPFDNSTISISSPEFLKSIQVWY